MSRALKTDGHTTQALVMSFRKELFENFLKAYDGIKAQIPHCEIFFDADSGLPSRRGRRGL